MLAMIFSAVVSLIQYESGKSIRAFVNCVLILAVALLTCGYFDHRGIFGDPMSLDHKTHYMVLSVTPIDDKSTAVILRKGDGTTVPIKFLTRVTVATNGLYTLVGDHYQNYSLAPIK
jgi:hypothetical protein